VVTSPPTNAAWFQQSEAYLTQQGFDAITVGAALGAYLAGIGLTPDQLNIVNTAIGAEGYPPVTPTAPHLLPATGQSGSTTGGSITNPPPVPPPSGTPTPAPTGNPPSPTPSVPDGLYNSQPSGQWWVVQGGRRWQVAAAVSGGAHGTKLGYGTPITDATINQLPLVGIWQGAIPFHPTGH
jgi:hypothetical protein